VKIIPYSVLAATLVGGMLGASTSTTSAAPAQASNGQTGSKVKPALGAAADLPVGTTICAELAKPLDVKKAKAGDTIVARATLPVLWQGKVVIANDAKIIGRVTQAKSHLNPDGASQIGILFGQAMLKDGKLMPLALTVQAIGAPALTTISNEGEGLQRPDVNPPPGRSLSGMHAPSLNPPTDPPPGYTHPKGPMLDASSHGAIGLPELSLKESATADHESLVTSAKKDVRLDGGTEIVLRVIAAPDGEASKP
jgi:hypothetical protein